MKWWRWDGFDVLLIKTRRGGNLIGRSCYLQVVKPATPWNKSRGERRTYRLATKGWSVIQGAPNCNLCIWVAPTCRRTYHRVTTAHYALMIHYRWQISILRDLSINELINQTKKVQHLFTWNKKQQKEMVIHNTCKIGYDKNVEKTFSIAGSRSENLTAETISCLANCHGGEDQGLRAGHVVRAEDHCQQRLAIPKCQRCSIHFLWSFGTF